MGKKKSSRGVVDDDEYSMGIDLSDDPPLQDSSTTQSQDNANNNKGNKKVSGKINPTSLKDDNHVSGSGQEDKQLAIKKSKSKESTKNHVATSAFEALAENENENDDAIDLEEKNLDTQEFVSFSGKKKGKKAGRKESANNDNFDAEFGIVNNATNSQEVDRLKKSKPKNIDSSSGVEETDDINYDTGDLEKNDQDDEVKDHVSLSGKNKSSKSIRKVSNMFDGVSLDNYTQQVEEAVDEPALSSTGEKKSSKVSKKSVIAMTLLDENVEVDSEDMEDDNQTITFFGKKKSSRNAKKIALDASIAEGDDDDSVHELIQPIETVDKAVKDGVNSAKKLKKNKKKSARTVQEEEDLDKILEELGEKLILAPLSEPVQAMEVGLGLEENDGQAEALESAASKKKKKRKEKEKEKRAAAASTVAEDDKVEDAKNKTSDKKVPKHVREMQEQLARRKEAEEKKKKEEEEKLRKEEEERKRQEEMERLAEEAKRRKKEREKEKMLKKKQEGKLLTGKQKESQRKLEAQRNQILAQGVTLPPADYVTKKPIYERKKSKPASVQLNDKVDDKISGLMGVEVAKEMSNDSEPCSEAEKACEDSFSALPDERMSENGAEMEDEEDDDEWDAKSWDDAEIVGLPLRSAFDEEDEEEDFLVKKGETIKHAPDTIVSVPLLSSTKSVTTDIIAKKTAPLGSSQMSKGKNQEVVATKPKMQEIADSQESQASKDVSKNSESLRSPICCILGHVDTGKTKLLDCIRGTNVQEGEAGGITQQIGATYFPAESIRERTKELKADAKLLVPGLLVIDTPGHESFTNLRSRGSGLCDIAILVVDIMHGLEPQTIESLNLLKMRNTEFIVALNKVDRLYGWKATRNAPIVKSMKLQSVDVQNEFKMRLTEIITQFKEQGLNTELYYKNKEMGQTYSIVPTSAITGEGIPDLLLLLVQWTQKTMEKKLLFVNEVQCTVLEVKVDPGHGVTIDVILVNGVLHSGDQIVVCGMQGPIATTIRALLTPHPMKELRIKGGLLSHDQIKAAQGVKIAAQGLDHAIAGTGLHVVKPDDDLEAIMDVAMQDVKSVMSRIDKSGDGVCVQASTLGSLEALLEFLKSPAVKIPVSGISIGPVHKKDVMRASVMLERKKEYATILAFDVKVTPEARELAEEAGVKIFCADIIYHLFDQFKAYIDNLKEEKKKEAAEEAVFPCVLKIMPNCVFNKKDPIVLGVDVLDGLAKVGTLICVPSRDFIDIGRITSIEINHKQVDIAKKGQKVAIKIVGSNPEEQQKMYGRHFEIDDELVSHITRRSIDVLKANYREDLSIEEWRLVVKLKNLFKIQ